MIAHGLTPRRFDWMPWIFALGMLVVVAVNGALVYFAFSSWYGLAADHAYERGRAYNKVLEAADRQEALGWSLTAALRPVAGGVELVVGLSDRDGRALEGLTVTAVLERPVGQAERRQAALTMQSPGRYVARLNELPRGQWIARIGADGAGAHVVSARRLTAP